MDRLKIMDMVDRKVISSFQDGFSIGAIQSELKVRMDNFKKTIGKDVDLEELYAIDYEDIKCVRHRYGIAYIKQCEKRIIDLNWILDNKQRLRHKSNREIFGLIKFKEKLAYDSVPF